MHLPTIDFQGTFVRFPGSNFRDGMGISLSFMRVGTLHPKTLRVYPLIGLQGAWWWLGFVAGHGTEPDDLYAPCLKLAVRP